MCSPAAARRRPLRRKPQPPAALLPVSSHLEALPSNIQDLYLGSLKRLGLDTSIHDVRFVEDNWNPHPRRLGLGLGGVVKRHGGHAIYLFPTGGRLGVLPGER